MRNVLSTLTAICAPFACAGAAAQTPPALAEGATMPKITVTATLSPQDVDAAPASTSVITRSELQERNATDLAEALRDAAGFTFSPRQVGGRKTVALRGLEGRHTLTLIDGRRIAPTDDVVGHSDYQYGWLPMSAVERIEVVRGPMSALYGSEALGGVINIITRQAMDRWAGSASLSAGAGAGDGNGSAGASVFVTGPLAGSLLLRLNAEHQRTNPVRDVADPRTSEIEGRETTSAGAGLVLAISRAQSVEVGWTAAREVRLYDDISGATAYRNRYDVDRDHAHVTWQGTFGAVRSQLRAYRSEIDVLNSRSAGVATTRPQHLGEDVADGFIAFGLGAHRFTAGGEWRREKLINAGLVGGSDAATHEALFVQDEVSLAGSLMLTAGLRYDHHELFGGETSPRAYLVWEASPELVVKGGFGHAFKAPTLKQNSPNYIGAEGPHTFMGNAAIKPESSNSAELAASWARGGVKLRGSVYRSELRDLITYRLIRQVGVRRTYLYDNVNRARITGLEAGLSLDLAAGLTWSTDIALLRTEDRLTGKALADRPRTSGSTSLAWRGGDGWSARIGGSYTGSQVETAGATLPAYWLWNASVGKRFGTTWSLRMGAENLGNLRLAEKSASFGYAERARRVFVSGRAEF